MAALPSLPELPPLEDGTVRVLVFDAERTLLLEFFDLPLTTGMTYRDARFEVGCHGPSPFDIVPLDPDALTPVSNLDAPLPSPTTELSICVPALFIPSPHTRLLRVTLHLDFVVTWAAQIAAAVINTPILHLQLRQTLDLVATGRAHWLPHYLRHAAATAGLASLTRGQFLASFVGWWLPEAARGLLLAVADVDMVRRSLAAPPGAPPTSPGPAALVARAAALVLPPLWVHPIRLLLPRLAPSASAPAPRPSLVAEVLRLPSWRDFRRAFRTALPALPVTLACDIATQYAAHLMRAHAPELLVLSDADNESLVPLAATLLCSPLALAARFVLFSLPERAPVASLRALAGAERHALFLVLAQDAVLAAASSALASYAASYNGLSGYRAVLTTPRVTDSNAALGLLLGRAASAATAAACAVALWRWVARTLAA